MNIQDRKKTLTVEELRRRYNLDALDKDRKAIKLQKDQLNKVDAELNDFVEITTKNIKELQDQVDGNITTWFFNGVPTVDSEPASSWITDTDKNNHLGDLYYDQDTGYAYRFYLDGTTNEYGWMQVIDSDVAEALAIANAAKDTADSKRRVFVAQPTPPYDIGDIWIKEDTDLYRCRVSRSEGSFNIADWIRATNYTDDTVALGTKAELDQFKTQVTENYVSNATLETTVNSITGKVEETYTYVTTVENQVNDITTTTQTSTGGNTLHIIDALESNALEYHIDGKCEQGTSVQGKNYFTGNKISNGTGLGITYSFDNSIIKLNGTSTASATIMNGFTKITLPAGTYTYYLGLKSGSFTLNGKDLAIYLRSSDAFITGNAATSGNTLGEIKSTGSTKKTFTITEDTDLYIRMFVNGAGLVCEDLELYLQIEQGSSYTGFEQFTPNSPSPDYPSEIKTIPSIRNLINPNEIISGGYSVGNGNYFSSETSFCTKYKIKIDNTKPYYLSHNVNNANQYYYVLYYDENENYLGHISSLITTKTMNLSTYTSYSQAKYINIRFDAPISYINEIQLEEGSVAHDFVPYGRWAKVKITGKNLFDKSLFNTFTSSLQYINLTLKPNTTYVMSSNIPQGSSGANLFFVNNGESASSSINPVQNNYPHKLTTDDTGKVQIAYRNQANSLDNVNPITDYWYQIEENSTKTKYEEYKEKEVLIDLNKPNLLETPYTEDNKLTITATKDDFIVTTDYYIELEAGKTYAFSCKTSGTFGNWDKQTQCYLLLDKAYATTIHITDKDNFTFTPTTSGKYYLRCDVNVNGETHSFWDFKIVEGYTDYYELSSIGDTKDELSIIDGQVVINKKIGKVVLDGSENITSNAYGTNSFNIPITNGKFSGDLITTKSSHFTSISYNDRTKEVVNSAFVANEIIFIIRNTTFTSVDAFKTWLSENNTEVYYELKEPQQIILPNTNIPLFDGVNHITLVDDLETTTSIKFLRQTPISGEYATNQQLGETNYNLANTTSKTNENTLNLNATNTNLNNNYYTKPQIDIMNTATTEEITTIKKEVETKITAEDLTIAINQIKTTGATSVETTTGYKFNEEGLSIQKSGSEMSSLLDNDGLVVKRSETEMLTVRSSGVEAENITVRTYFTIGDNTRAENYKGGTGFFYIGGDD